ncbi:6-carboxytetrahydropterin synthase [Acrasis kona]|uniref:6-pyruvoyl tetrahydrobiopterin synthase n=1 Tax=Acrasis kona TaxID=1008807 RepID=A0AAW2ZN18_9EUKA
MTQPRCYLSRRETFSAAHRLHSKELSDEENKAIYDKCNHINGHGHNYVLKVTVFGDIDKRTGMVVNLTDLTSYMKIHVLQHLDHKNLDLDVEYFKNQVSTTENLAVYIWAQLKPHLGDLLHEIKIGETEKNQVVYRGD